MKRFSSLFAKNDRHRAVGRLPHFVACCAEPLEHRLLFSAVPATIYNFGTGLHPHGVAVDSSGNLFTATQQGGLNNLGLVLEMGKGSSNITSLYSFTGGNDGSGPYGLTVDSSGNLFGTTQSNGFLQYGTVFEIARGSEAITTLYNFTGSPGATQPAAITIDSNGDLFGTTLQSNNTIWELARGPNGRTFSTLYTFNGGPLPDGIVVDAGGNVFVSTFETGANRVGAIWELARGSTVLTTRIAFARGSFGAYPYSISMDASGNIFGVSESDQSSTNGDVWELPRGSNTLTMLYSFTNRSDGGYPQGIAVDGSGSIYGTTETGGEFNGGTIFDLSSFRQLTFGGVPANAIAGHAISPSVTVDIQTSTGQIISTDNSAVTLSVVVGPGTLGGTLTVHAINGVATFSNLVIDTSGTYQLYASDGSANPTVSAAFTISPAPATHLVFAAGPTNANAGAKLSPPVVVYEMDQFNNIVRTDNSLVTLSVQSGPGGISGNAGVNLNNGAAIFNNIAFNTPGSYALIAQDGALTPIISNSFQIAQQYQLVFAADPRNTTAGTIYNPPIVVYVMDQLGNIIRNVNTTVTLSVASGPGNLSGTLSVNLNNGAAIFSNVSLSTAGTYALTASGGTYTSITSPTFVVS